MAVCDGHISAYHIIPYSYTGSKQIHSVGMNPCICLHVENTRRLSINNPVKMDIKSRSLIFDTIKTEDIYPVLIMFKTVIVYFQ